MRQMANCVEHDWSAYSRQTRTQGAVVPHRRAARHIAALTLLLTALLADKGVADVTPRPNGEQIYLTTQAPSPAADRSIPWYSYVGENLAPAVRSIEGRGFKCKLSSTLIDSARSEHFATVKLPASETVVLDDLQQFNCSQDIIGIDLGYRTLVRGHALEGIITSLALIIKNDTYELRRQVYDSYIGRAVNLTGMSILEASEYGVRAGMNGCPYIWDEDRVELMFELSSDISIFVDGSRTDQLANCVSYVHAALEKSRRDKIDEVERRLWDERVQPAVDLGKQRRLKSSDF